jgi:hypothetical protein
MHFAEPMLFSTTRIMFLLELRHPHWPAPAGYGQAKSSTGTQNLVGATQYAAQINSVLVSKAI